MQHKRYPCKSRTEQFGSFEMSGYSDVHNRQPQQPRDQPHVTYQQEQALIAHHLQMQRGPQHQPKPPSEPKKVNTLQLQLNCESNGK